MKFYSVNVKVVTPMIISERVGFRGFIYRSLRSYIPGSMFRGALLTKLIEEGFSQKEVNSLALNPDFSVTSLLASNSNNPLLIENTLIAHYLCQKSKWPGKDVVLSPGIENVISAIKRGRVDLEAAISDATLNFTLKLTSRGEVWFQPGELKSCGGKVVSLEHLGWRISRVDVSSYIQVSLDHVRGAVSPGLIYAYEQVKPGTTYTGFITALDTSPIMSLIRKVASSSVYLRIGRGISRGYGLVELRARPIDPRKLIEKVISEPIKLGDIVALEVLTPTFTLEPLPKPFIKGSVIEVDEAWFSKMTGQLVELKLKILDHPVGSLRKYVGWSLRTNTPKLPVKGLSPGSLLICKIESCSVDVNEALPLLPFIGVNDFSAQGFNQLIPMNVDPFPSEVK